MLQVRGLTKGYGGRTVLDGLDLDVAAGEVVALVGPNGVGKSTALRCIVGSESPDAGEVRLGEALLDTRVPQTRRALCKQSLLPRPMAATPPCSRTRSRAS